VEKFFTEPMRNLLSDALFRHVAIGLVLAVPAAALAAPVLTRRKQESMRQLFAVKSVDGKTIGSGEEVSTAEGDHMRSVLTFRFLDGSLDEQVTTYTQGNVFRLIHDHHVQKGPSFPTPLDVSVDVPTGTVTWHSLKNGNDEVTSQHMKLPDDLANGLVPLLTENVPPGSAGLAVSWVAIAVRPMIVTLTIQPDHGSDTAPPLQHASRYLLHVELHGLALLLAPMLNKQPADLHVWVTDASQPSFLRMHGPFYQGGPVWTVQSLGEEIATAAH
jgi:hypothetical protein